MPSNLKAVEGAVYAGFRRLQYKAMFKDRLGLFHVSDFVNSCQRNAYYQHLDSETFAGKDTAQNSILFAGEAVHQLLDRTAHGGHGEHALAWNLLTDKPVNLEDRDGTSNYTLRDWSGIVIGESDALYTDSNMPTVIVDYKTWLSKPGQRYAKSLDPVHKEQINVYKWLHFKMYGVDYPYGAVIYLDFADRFKKPIIHAFEIDAMSDIENRLHAKQALFAQALFTGKLPPANLGDWKCNGYCAYAEHCMSHDEIDLDDNKVRIVH